MDMDKMTTIWLVIAVYGVFMLAVGILNSRKSAGMEEFTVGGRNAGAWLSALSYGTAYFSAVMFIGYSGGSGWSFGLWSVLVGIGNALIGSLLAWIVLAKRTREVTRRLKISSMPQLFEKRFGSKKMRMFACVIIFVFLIPYSASVYKGLTSVCSVLLGIDEQVCMIMIALASAVVLVLGGYMATLKADFVQGFVMMFGVSALLVLVVIGTSLRMDLFTLKTVIADIDGSNHWLIALEYLLHYAGSFVCFFAIMGISPTRKTFFSYVGVYSVYVYALHLFFIVWLRYVTPAIPLPGKGWVLLYLAAGIPLTLLLASNPVRRIFRPFIEPKVNFQRLLETLPLKQK